MTPRRELVEPNAPLSMRWQCELLGVNRVLRTCRGEQLDS